MGQVQQQQAREDDRQGTQQVEGLPLAVRHADTNLQQAVQAGDGRQKLFQQQYDVTEEGGAEEDDLFQPVDDSVTELLTLLWGTRGSSWSPMQFRGWRCHCGASVS